MNSRKTYLTALVCIATLAACAKNPTETIKEEAPDTTSSVVYFTDDISAESLVRIYEALNVSAERYRQANRAAPTT